MPSRIPTSRLRRSSATATSPATKDDGVPRYLLMATHVPRSGSSGGIVRYTVALAAALAPRTDIELHVLAAGDGADFFADLLPAHRVHRLPAAPTAVQSLREWVGAAHALRSGRFDVVHGTKHIVPLFARGAIRVLTVHDMLLLDRPADFPLLKRLLLRRPYRSSIQRADVLIAVSGASRSRVLDYVPAAADRMAAVPLAASSALLDAPAEPVDELVGSRFALVVGDASERKNLRLAVRTWSAVRAAVPGAVLVVVGPRPWGAEDTGGAEWDRLVADGSLVPMRGISDGTLRWCYEHAAVLLCPSVIEGFGLPVVEAAAFGTAVVTSDDPALCEAATGWSSPTAAWSAADWTETVVAQLRGTLPTGTTSDAPARTWDDVADETVRAVLHGHRNPSASAAPVSFAGRIGISPYRAPLRVLHVIARDDAGARETAQRLAEVHRGYGWTVDVAVGVPVRRSAPLVETARDVDVVVLHGSDTARLRLRLRGRVTTVVLAHRTPGGPIASLVEAALGRWTHALVLPGREATPAWDRMPVPLTRLSASDVDPDEVAAILVRARAWGGGRRPDDRRPPAHRPIDEELLMKTTVQKLLPEPVLRTAKPVLRTAWRVGQQLNRRAGQIGVKRSAAAEQALQGRIAYNEFGGYCVPLASRHRPAAQRILAGTVWERDTIDFITGNAGDGDIVHAGTYFGDFLPALSRSCADGAMIWAFEPHPEHFRCAQITALINNLTNVELRHAGLGELRGSLGLEAYDDQGRPLGGGSHVVGGDPPAVDSAKLIQVDICTIDDVVPVDRKVSIIQLDVEGFEREALAGAVATIKRNRPILILESLPDSRWMAENILALGYTTTGRLSENTVFTPT